MENVISLRAVKFEKMYRDYYTKPENKSLQLRVWLYEDIKQTKTS
jgi:hypothetical protein